MSNKKQQNEDNQTFTIIGIVFSVLGLSFLIGEITRPSGIAFFVIGITFLIIGLSSKSKKIR